MMHRGTRYSLLWEKSVYQKITAIAALALLGCMSVKSSPEPKLDMTEVDIEVEVQGFVANALHDDFVGGGHRSYHATRIRILRPLMYQGRSLLITHSSMPEEDSFWRSPGALGIISVHLWVLEEEAGDVPATWVQIKSRASGR